MAKSLVRSGRLYARLDRRLLACERQMFLRMNGKVGEIGEVTLCLELCLIDTREGGANNYQGNYGRVTR